METPSAAAFTADPLTDLFSQATLCAPPTKGAIDMPAPKTLSLSLLVATLACTVSCTSTPTGTKTKNGDDHGMEGKTAFSGGVPIEVKVGVLDTNGTFTEVSTLDPNIAAVVQVAFTAPPTPGDSIELYFESTKEIERRDFVVVIPINTPKQYFYIPFRTTAATAGPGRIYSNHVFVTSISTAPTQGSLRRTGASDDFSIRQ